MTFPFIPKASSPTSGYVFKRGSQNLIFIGVVLYMLGGGGGGGGGGG